MHSSPGEVLVLGGGVIGLSCALYLLRSGIPVRVLERGSVGCGSSHGNCGTLTPSHAAPLSRPGVRRKALRWALRQDAPLYVNPRLDLDRVRWLAGFARRCNAGAWERAARERAALLMRSRVLIEHLVEEYALDCEFAASGGLHLFREPRTEADERRQLPLWQRLGIEVELLDAQQTRERVPCLRDEVVGGMFFPNDGRLRPDRFVSALARQVRAMGGRIEEGVEVLGFETGGGRIRGVRTAGGLQSAGHTIVALGAWTPLLARGLGLRVPLQPGKGYSQTWSRPQACPGVPLVLVEDSICVTAWDSGFRLGSTMEFSGYAEGLNEVRLAAIERGAARYLKVSAGPELQERWWGWRPMCVDEVPIIGPSTRYANLTWATGHGMLGISMSAGTGELVAAQISGGAPPLPPEPYAPARFGL
ncbi:MAG TPA: FAD-dependent oxidoreductase [Rhodanobacteraceae bacterium]|nr:FAD-dependent oxidoreductase [Rhodanobacteraceae bacterium]